MSAAAACGFPSPADDYLDRALDFNELLVENAPATFAVRVSGDSMTGIGLFGRQVDRSGPSRRRVRTEAISQTGSPPLAAGRESRFQGHRNSGGHGLRGLGRGDTLHQDAVLAAPSRGPPHRDRRLQQFLCLMRARLPARIARPSGRRA